MTKYEKALKQVYAMIYICIPTYADVYGDSQRPFVGEKLRETLKFRDDFDQLRQNVHNLSKFLYCRRELQL